MSSVRDVIRCQIKGSDVRKQTFGWFEPSDRIGPDHSTYYVHSYQSSVPVISADQPHNQELLDLACVAS